MKLFNKEKKKKREIKEDDPLLVKLWYNERTHAAIVLALYLIFFGFIILFINLTSKPKITSRDIKGSKINNLFTILDEKDVSYNYVITIGNKKYYFSGFNRDDDIYGTLLYNGESQSIKVSNNECMVGTYNDKDEFVPAYSLCPENINYNYFKYNLIYDLIKDVSGYKFQADNYYIFTLKDNTEIKIYYDADDILVSVIISGKNYNYLLEYSLDNENIDSEQTNIE